MWCYFNAVASIVVKVNSIMLPRSTEVIILLYDKHSKHSRTTLLNLKLICRMAEQEFRCTWHLCLGVEFITKDSFINYWRANFPNWNERFFCFQSKTRIIAEPEHRANLDDYSFASLHRFFFYSEISNYDLMFPWNCLRFPTVLFISFRAAGDVQLKARNNDCGEKLREKRNNCWMKWGVNICFLLYNIKKIVLIKYFEGRS